MKLYLAAPWADKDLMTDIATKFTEVGHEITWRWWDEAKMRPKEWGRESTLRWSARMDMNGVNNADTLILFDTSLSEGKAVEQGIAIAKGIPIIAVGTYSTEDVHNIFHYLDNYKWVEKVEDAVEYVSRVDEVCKRYACKPSKTL